MGTMEIFDPPEIGPHIFHRAADKNPRQPLRRFQDPRVGRASRNMKVAPGQTLTNQGEDLRKKILTASTLGRESIDPQRPYPKPEFSIRGREVIHIDASRNAETDSIPYMRLNLAASISETRNHVPGGAAYLPFVCLHLRKLRFEEKIFPGTAVLFNMALPDCRQDIVLKSTHCPKSVKLSAENKKSQTMAS